MALTTQCRVQTIKGQFERTAEQAHTSPNYTRKPSSQSHINNKSNIVPKNGLSNNINLPRHDAPTNQICPLDNNENHQSPKSSCSSLSADGTRTFPVKSNDNCKFGTFAEKQKLVESIVLNIKNSTKDERDDKTPKTKNSFVALFDRDMKEAFEKGVRKFSIGKKETPIRSAKLISEDKNQPRHPENIKANTLLSPHKSMVEKTFHPHGKDDERNNNSFVDPVPPPRKRVTRKKSQAPSPPYSQPSRQPTDSDEDPFPSYCRDPFNVKPEHKDRPKPKCDVTRLPGGPAPQKPPRTFAHDIYRQAKGFETAHHKLDPRIESLYTKVNKKPKPSTAQSEGKEKSVSFVEPHLRPGKPAVAPKPAHLSPKKRLSVIEPLESTPQEFPDKKTSIKRNSSFRFSFRNAKRSSPSPTRLSHISKFREIARSWTRLRSPDDQHTNRSKSEEFLCKNKDPNGPIYAVPHEVPRVQNNTEELHYMVSPLFPGYESAHKSPGPPIIPSPDLTPAGTDKPRVSWGGMKNEFRQSCRKVQRRLRVTGR